MADLSRVHGGGKKLCVGYQLVLVDVDDIEQSENIIRRQFWSEKLRHGWRVQLSKKSME